MYAGNGEMLVCVVRGLEQKIEEEKSVFSGEEGAVLHQSMSNRDQLKMCGTGNCNPVPYLSPLAFSLSF